MGCLLWWMRECSETVLFVFRVGKIHYLDFTSQYPYMMSNPKYFYPISEPVILVKRRDELMPIVSVLGVLKVLIEALGKLYFPVRPEQSV